VVTAPLDHAPALGEWVPLQTFRPSDLPTVMRKAFDLARDSVDG
jgi:A/G-specific adenine glycosylase